MLILFKLIRESYLMAAAEISANKTRTILSLLGITIGIFCVVSVFTVFDSMERSIKSSIESLGSNVVYIQKWPWLFVEDYPWWRYVNRPETKLEELKKLQERSQTADAFAFLTGTSRTVKSLRHSLNNITVMAVTYDYFKLRNMEIAEGRYFSPLETNNGRNVVILGNTIAQKLFDGEPAVGQQVKIYGLKTEVIGVLKKEGNNMGEGLDEQVIVPVLFAANFLNIDRDGSIAVSPKEDISKQELIDELTGIMRSMRKLSPGMEDNFSINEISTINARFEQFFRVMTFIGWIIGGFSLLVGGFGIANIMFVSVKERTSIIGIQKALGAKNYFILLQFLFEAIFLSLLGGILGLLIIFIFTLISTYVFKFQLVLTLANIVLGITVSIVIGLIAGIVPSYVAARMDPVEAMRSTF